MQEKNAESAISESEFLEILAAVKQIKCPLKAYLYQPDEIIAEFLELIHKQGLAKMETISIENVGALIGTIGFPSLIVFSEFQSKLDN